MAALASIMLSKVVETKVVIKVKGQEVSEVVVAIVEAGGAAG